MGGKRSLQQALTTRLQRRDMGIDNAGTSNGIDNADDERENSNGAASISARAKEHGKGPDHAISRHRLQSLEILGVVLAQDAGSSPEDSKRPQTSNRKESVGPPGENEFGGHDGPPPPRPPQGATPGHSNDFNGNEKEGSNNGGGGGQSQNQGQRQGEGFDQAEGPRPNPNGEDGQKSGQNQPDNNRNGKQGQNKSPNDDQTPDQKSETRPFKQTSTSDLNSSTVSSSSSPSQTAETEPRIQSTDSPSFSQASSSATQTSQLPPPPPAVTPALLTSGTSSQSSMTTASISSVQSFSTETQLVTALPPASLAAEQPLAALSPTTSQIATGISNSNLPHSSASPSSLAPGVIAGIIGR